MLASYAHGPSATPLLGETIGENLRRTVERFGEREALVVRSQGYRATYSELWEQVDRAARAFLAAGVRKGDRVGVWAPNRHEWVVTQFATARVGAILVTINPAYKATELEHALRTAGVGVLVMARGFRGSEYVPMLDAVRGRCPALRRVIVLEDDWDVFLAEGARVGDEQLAQREAQLQFDEPINVQFTSGTTGLPKGATLSHHNIVNNAFFVAEALRFDERDRACVPVPFYHCFGMVLGTLACATHGACLVVPGESFDAGGRPRGGRRRALHRPLRRADDVHRRARRARLRPLRPVHPAYGDDGRRAVPGRGHEARALRDAHAGGHDHLRDDRDLAGLDADRGRRPGRAGASRPWAASTRTSR